MPLTKEGMVDVFDRVQELWPDTYKRLKGSPAQKAIWVERLRIHDRDIIMAAMDVCVTRSRWWDASLEDILEQVDKQMVHRPRPYAANGQPESIESLVGHAFNRASVSSEASAVDLLWARLHASLLSVGLPGGSPEKWLETSEKMRAWGVEYPALAAMCYEEADDYETRAHQRMMQIKEQQGYADVS